MKEINLRKLYPDTYRTDILVEVSDQVWAEICTNQRSETAYERRKFRYKAHYSLDYGNGIEKAAITRTSAPDDLLEEKQKREELYTAVMSLPKKQAKRIYAHFYLGMTPAEIAEVESVDVSCVRRSIRNGLKRLAKKLR